MMPHDNEARTSSGDSIGTPADDAKGEKPVCLLLLMASRIPATPSNSTSLRVSASSLLVWAVNNEGEDFERRPYCGLSIAMALIV